MLSVPLPSPGVRAVAVFEAAKGALVLLVACGAVAAVFGEGAQVEAAEIVRHLHVDPGRRLPRVFLHAAADLSDGQILAVAGLALVYALFRFAEAYGLWFGRAWAEWLAAASGGIYLPYELAELAKGVSVIKIGLLAMNAMIVVYMIVRLRKRAEARQRRV